MDSRHGLEIGNAFSSQVNTGVPVEIVEAENQTVEAVLSNEGNRQNVSREEEAMDISVDSGGMGNPQLASSIGVGPTGLSGIEAQQMSSTITSQLSAAVGQSQLMVPSSQLSSIGVDTTHISSQMGMGAIQLHENVEQQLQVSQSASSTQQFQQVNHQTLAAQALEISPESITFPSSQSTLASNIMHPHSSEADSNDTIPSNMLERAKEILGNVNYADLDISRAINSTVDPNLTVSSSMSTTTGGIDTSNILNDPEVPSSPESNFDSSELLNSTVMQQDEVTARLAQAGPIGVAAAAAVMSGRKRKRTHTFESNPALRKRHSSKLVRKLKDTMEELTARVGLQAVVVMYKPGKLEPKEEPSFKVFGATPLSNVVRNQKEAIVTEMDLSLQEQAPPPRSQEATLHELPPLVFDGIPTPVHKMTQAQLRAFIPNMLKYSTGRGKPGWAKNDMKPPWWPVEVPWQNVRSDSRQEHNKKDLSWTDALRRIVISCYVHHGRIDLLPEFSAEHLQQALTPEAAQQLQLQLDRLQQQGDFQQPSASSQTEEGTSTLGEVTSNQTQSDSQQVFTVDTGMGNCDTSGMPTLVDASLAETAARLQQVADETGKVQYATQTVTVTDRDAKALGQPVGSTTTVLLTAYPGGHSGGIEATENTQQYLAQSSLSSGIPNVQVVYSAAHIDSIPDSIVSSIPTDDETQTQPYTSDAATVPGSTQDHTISEYLNPAGQQVMVGATSRTNEADLASQLIDQYTSAESYQPHGINPDSGIPAISSGSEPRDGNTENGPSDRSS